MVRTLQVDNGAPIDIYVDFLMPRNAKVVTRDPPFLTDFAVQKADAGDMALKFSEMVAIEGKMPRGGINRVEIAVASIPALLAMKGFVLHGRDKPKDAYDVYYCVRNYPDGIDALAEQCRPLLDEKSGRKGFEGGCGRVARWGKAKVDRRAEFVDRSVKIGPFSTDLDVRFINPPTRRSWLTPLPAKPLLNFRGLFLYPTINCRMINAHAAFTQHLLEIAVADPVPAIPANCPEVNLTLVLPTFEITHAAHPAIKAQGSQEWTKFATEPFCLPDAWTLSYGMF